MRVEWVYKKNKKRIFSVLLVWVLVATNMIVIFPLNLPKAMGQVTHLGSANLEDQTGVPYDIGPIGDGQVIWDETQDHIIDADYTVESWMTLNIPALNYTTGAPMESKITFTGNYRMDVFGELITNTDSDPFTRTAFIGSDFMGFDGIYFQSGSRARIYDSIFIKSANGVYFMPNSTLTWPGVRDSEWEDPGIYGLRLDGTVGYTNMASSFLDDRLPSVPTATLLEVKNAWLNVSNTNFLGHGPNIPAVHLDNATVRFDSGTFYNDAQAGNSIFIEGNSSETVIADYDFREPALNNYYIRSEGSSYFSDNCSFRTEALGYTALASDNSSGAPSHPIIRQPTADGIPGVCDSSFDNSTLKATGNSSVTLQWYLHVHVIDQVGNPLPNSFVWVMNRYGNPAQPPYKQTNASGWATWFLCTELIVNNTHITNFNPFNVTASNGSLIGYAEVTMNKSKEITIWVPLGPPPPPSTSFKPPHSDYGLDTDGDGYFNYLVVNVTVNVSGAGYYNVNGELYDSFLTWIDDDLNLTFLNPGVQIVELRFEGWRIYYNGVNGPYNVDLGLYDELWNWLDSDTHITNFYTYNQFQPPSAMFQPPHSDYGLDNDGDGYYNYLIVNLSINVTVAGTYKVVGELFDSFSVSIDIDTNSTFLNTGIQFVEMQFDGWLIRKNGVDGPYSVELKLYDASSNLVGIDTYTTSSYLFTQFEGVEPDVYEIDDTYMQAKWIPVDGIIQHHNFHAEFNEDWIKFNATVGMLYIIETHNLIDADTIISLYETDGTTLLESNDNGGIGKASKIEWKAPSGDVYYVNVTEYWGNYSPTFTYDINITEFKPPTPPLDLQAWLVTSGKDVIISWNASPDDGKGENDVVGYTVYKSSTGVNGSYLFEEWIPANGSLSYNWTDINAGDGDWNDYFYIVRANDTLDNEEQNNNKVGKFVNYLVDGWNLISVPLIQINTSREYVLQTIKGNYMTIQRYHAGKSRPWLHWHRGKPHYFNDPMDINHKEGYYIDMIIPDHLVVAGKVPTNTQIPLKAGWNLVGYPCLINNTVNDALSSIAGKYNKVEYYDTLKNREVGLGPNDYMKPGLGYWIHATENCVWEI